MLRSRAKGVRRSAQELREHYNIEVELACRLKESTKEERCAQRLYTSLYDELFRRVPHHPQLTHKKSPETIARSVRWQRELLKNFIASDASFLDVGAGGCELAFSMAEMVRQVYAVDVSNVITSHTGRPRNFELLISHGSDIPLPDGCVDVAYSNQLMEHIHPDDAIEQLQDIYRVLKPNGRYICITPNRIGGPWDISYYFDDVATGFHLKEYTSKELSELFRQAGFRECTPFAGFHGNYIRFPLSMVLALETMLDKLPGRVRRGLGRGRPFRMLLGVRMVGVK